MCLYHKAMPGDPAHFVIILRPGRDVKNSSQMLFFAAVSPKGRLWDLQQARRTLWSAVQLLLLGTTGHPLLFPAITMLLAVYKRTKVYQKIIQFLNHSLSSVLPLALISRLILRPSYRPSRIRHYYFYHLIKSCPKKYAYNLKRLEIY